MKLSIFKRDKKKINSLRILGNIPAVVYAKGKENENIYINMQDFKKAIASLKSGDLSVQIFELEGKEDSFKALIKDIQYDVTSYNVIHIDFLRLDDSTEIKVNVPIRFTGVAKGIKEGGAMRQIIRSAKVKCLPKDLPKEFILEISDMSLGKVKRLSDIGLPKNVKLVSKSLAEVVVSIAKM